jgi:hypothetical protein
MKLFYEKKDPLSISGIKPRKYKVNWLIIKGISKRPGNKDLLFIRLIFNFADFLMEGSF